MSLESPSIFTDCSMIASPSGALPVPTYWNFR